MGADHADHGDSGDTAHVQLLLQEGHGSLIQVDDGAEAGKQDGDKEDDADDAAASHAVEHVGQIHEHQARAGGGGLHAAGGHGGQNDDHGQQGGQSVKQRHIAGGGGDVLVLGQIGAVDHGAVAGDGQGEERLAEGKQPKLPSSAGRRGSG